MVELISVHIPKTAGTAFRHILLDIYGLDRVLEDYPPDRIYQPDQAISNKIKVIHGHFDPRKYYGFFEDAKRIVWLRNPIFRLISEYFYALTIQDRNNVIHRQLLDNNLSLLKFAEIPAMRNFQSKKLHGMKLSEFYFVGIQEFYHQDLDELKSLFHWSNFQVSVKNNNTYPNYYEKLQELLSNHQLINYVADCNDQDMALYQEALELRAQRRGESRLLQTTLAEWNRSNFLIEQLQENVRKTENQLQQLQYWFKQSQVQGQRLAIIPSSRAEVSDQIWGFNFDAPRSPVVVDGNPVMLQGWVIGKKASVNKILLTNGGNILSETEVNISRPDVAKAYSFPGAENCGFELFLGISYIPQDCELTIQVLLENQTQIQLGFIRSEP